MKIVIIFEFVYTENSDVDTSNYITALFNNGSKCKATGAHWCIIKLFRMKYISNHGAG